MEKELDFSGSIADLMKQEGVNPESVLIVKNGEAVTVDVEVSDKDKVEFLSVVSGG